jgi:hypothetical protein
LRYYSGFTRNELEAMTDAEWAKEYAILQNIRIEEAKRKPFG